MKPLNEYPTPETDALKDKHGNVMTFNELLRLAKDQTVLCANLEQRLAAKTDELDGVRDYADSLGGKVITALREREDIKKDHQILAGRLAACRDYLMEIKNRAQDKTIELHPDNDAKGCVDDVMEWAEKALELTKPL